ncbi:Putative competence-damage inducible protein [Streptomyces antimycoticus]
MARGVRRALGADWGVATTGVAGPTPQDGQPVGTVHVAVAGPSEAVAAAALRLEGDRAGIRGQTVRAAVKLLFSELIATAGAKDTERTRRVLMFAAQSEHDIAPRTAAARGGTVGREGSGSDGPRREPPMILLRRLLGDVLRRQRQRQGRTSARGLLLRPGSRSAIMSEVERGAGGGLLRAALRDLRRPGRADVRSSCARSATSSPLAELARVGRSRPPANPYPAPVRPDARSRLGDVRDGRSPEERVTIKSPKEAVDVVAA